MIRFCEDVETMNDFDEFYKIQRRVRIMGLHETAELILWRWPTIINPQMFANLFKPREGN